MRIGELARELGVSAHALRFYERAGWLPEPERGENGYRSYRPGDVEHLKLLVDLRRMDMPLDVAARLATWCHSGHCEQTTQALPDELAARRTEIADRIERLRELDARLAELQRHLEHSSLGELTMVARTAACCDAAAAVSGVSSGCACCEASAEASALVS